MPEIDPEVKRKLNDEFARRLEEKGGSDLDVLIETEPGEAQAVANDVAGLPGTEVSRGGIVRERFVPAVVPEERLGDVASIPGVVRIHQDQRVGVNQGPDIVRPVLDIPFRTLQEDPIQTALSNAIEQFAGSEDPFLGKVGISKVEVPRINFAQLPPGDPFQTLLSAIDFTTGSNRTGKTFIPTSQSVDFIFDDDTLAEVSGAGTSLAVIDTGHTPTPDVNGGRTPRLESMVPGEPPTDFHGHGSWCTNTAVGGSAPSSWGRVQGVAPDAPYAHFKALNTFPGFGKTSWILNAMEAANEWGADVISMSLGGAQQGPIDQDPFVQVIDELSKETLGPDDGSIFVIAAGNSGSAKWTIGSPGVAPKALTVASWSLLDQAPAHWSSRGPQGDWYKDNPERFQQDLNRTGSTFIKPDVAAPGGGRETPEKTDNDDELLHQVETGWAEGLFDGLKDARGLMHGTSQATPHAAGLVALAFEAGLIETAADVKTAVRSAGPIPEFSEAAPTAHEVTNGKNIAVGYGLATSSVFSLQRPVPTTTVESAFR